MRGPAGVDVAEKILTASRTIAVVGLSANPLRPSHGVARYLQRVGYRIIPVNPNVEEVLGERAYPSLLDIPQPVDVVEVFRRSEFVGPIVNPRSSGCASASGVTGLFAALPVRRQLISAWLSGRMAFPIAAGIMMST